MYSLENGVNTSVSDDGNSKEGEPAVQQHLKALINEANRIGNNVNQIVHGNHMGFYSKEDRESLEAYMRRLNLRVKEVADKLGD